MDKNDQNILSGTFTNLHITNKKSNIASIVKEMDKEEMDNIKLITSSPKSEYIKNRIRKKFKNNKKSILNELYLLDNKKSFPLIKNRRESNQIISSKFIFSDNNISNTNNNQKNKNENKSPKNIKKHYLLDKRVLRIEQCLSEKKDKKNYNIAINDKKEKIINTNLINRNKKISYLLNSKKNNRNKTLDINNFNNMFNIKSKKINNFITESTNKINTDKYYQTAKHFSEKKLFSNKKIINNKRKSSFLYKTKTFDFIKSLHRLKLSEAHLSDIENKLNTVYENNKYDFKEKDKEIKEFKKKYQTIYDKFEELVSYDIARISKEINDQFLSLKFNDFFQYLLTILKNYDKRIVDWKFTVEKEIKDCPDELRLKNVKKKHKSFKDKLNKQYDWGMKANKFMDDLILNSKKKSMMFLNERYKKNFNELVNKNMNKDPFVDKIFEYNEIYKNNNNII